MHMNNWWQDVFSNLVGSVGAEVLVLLAPVLWFFFSNKKSLIKFNRPSNSKPQFTKETDQHYFKIGEIIDNKSKIEDFKRNGFVGISWNDLGDLGDLVGQSEDSICATVKERLMKLKDTGKDYYKDQHPTTLAHIARYFGRLLTIKKGDIIVVPVSGSDDVYIFQATSGYEYNNSLTKENIAQGIQVNSKNYQCVNFSQLPTLSFTPTFKRAVRSRLTLISLDNYSEQINSLIY